MKSSIVSVVLIGFLFSGYSKPSTSENLIHKFYSNKEIEELNRITAFVINEMSKECDETS